MGNASAVQPVRVAVTVMAMLVSAMVVVAQIGTTIGLGLLFDTLDSGVHDTVHRGATWPMVLVAAGGARSARAHPAPSGGVAIAPNYAASAPIVYRSTSPDEGAADGQHR